jgi:hypothetical protein
VRRLLVGTALAIASARPAYADGVYFSQTIGIGSSNEDTIGRAIRTRASIGARVRWLAIESWVASDTRYARDGGLLFIGGEPREGSDLASYGVATRAIVPLHRAPKATLEGYVRAGAGIATANGELEGFRGHTMGAGGGLQLRGRVRALGFLWAPLFLLHRGPHVTGALFVDGGFDRVELRMGDRSLTTTVSQMALGFAIGSTF